jgi:hypothetical protein
MAWRFSHTSGDANDAWDGAWDRDTPVYVWSLQASTGAQAGSLPALPEQGASEPTDGRTTPPAIAATSGPDIFVLDKSTLADAMAFPPSVRPVPDYKAAEGDLIDFSSLLQVSFAPLTPDAVQLRVAEDSGATFATLQLNVRSAADPFWTTVAKLDGVHAGDAVNVALDATHTVHLSAGWMV